MKLSSLVRRYPVSSYFVLVFVISWSGILVLAGVHGMPTTREHFARSGPLAMTPFLLGPGIASLGLTALLGGRRGLRELLSRALRWRVGLRWYAFSVLALPVLLGAVLLVLSQVSPAFLPSIVTAEDKLVLLITGLVVGIVGGGLLEEIGWTGFATPVLLERHGVLRAGLILGSLWGLWHLVPTLWGSGDASARLDLAVFLPGLFFHYAGLVPFRILMVWAWQRTRSPIPPQLMHASLTAGMFFVFNLDGTGMPLFVYYAVVAAALWMGVAAVFVTGGAIVTVAPRRATSRSRRGSRILGDRGSRG